MKKNNSLKIFNILARRVYKVSKKRKLGWKWSDAQKWTSANLFKRYKGTAISKIRVTNVDKEVIAILDSTPMPLTGVSAPKVEVCTSVLSVTDSDIEDIPFWILEDAIFGGNGKLGFEDNLKVAIELDGIFSTGIIKKGDLSNSQIKQLITDIRKYISSNGENYYTIVFLRKQVPNTTDSKNPCNTYLLITGEGSSYDNEDNEIEELVSEKNLTKEQREEREKRKAESEAEKQKKVTQKATKKKERPQQVEPKTKGQVDTESEKYKALQFALEMLRSDVKEGLITKKQYQDRQKLILDKFNLGGEI
jgi:hypothetical protein